MNRAKEARKLTVRSQCEEHTRTRQDLANIVAGHGNHRARANK